MRALSLQSRRLNALRSGLGVFPHAGPTIHLLESQRC